MTRRGKGSSRRGGVALLVLVLAAPVGVAAQEEGIDLSPEKKGTEPKAPKGAEEKPGREGVLGPALGVPGEKDAALADRVKAVQRKGFLKRGRLELTLDLPATLNDSFFQKVGAGGRLAYNFHDSFALALRGAYWWTVRTNHVQEGQAAFQSLLLSSKPFAQAMLDGIWSPVYGKASLLGSSIVHFDFFLLGGAGAVWSDTSIAPRREGPHPAADLGGGLRFYPADWLAVELSLVATLYPDRPSKSAPSTTTNILAASLGLSFFLPTSFQYVYP